MVFVIAIGIIATVTVTILGIMIFSNAETQETSFTELIFEASPKKPGWLKEITSKKENKKLEAMEVLSLKKHPSLEEVKNRNQHVSSFELLFYRGMVSYYEAVLQMDSAHWYLLDSYCADSELKISNIQFIDDETIAIPFHVQYVDDDYDPVYSFCVFRKVVSREREYWILTGEVFCFNLNETHTSSDYDLIREGSELEELYAIDSSIKYDCLRRPFHFDDCDAFPVFKLLDDGVICFKISKNQPIVLGKTFIPYSDYETLADYNIHITDPSLLDCLLTEK